MLFRLKLDLDSDEADRPAGSAVSKVMKRRRSPAHTRALREWLASSQERFALHVQLKRTADGSTDLEFPAIHHAIRGFLSESGISVVVNYLNQDWDCIFDVDASPKRLKDGYICTMCLPEYKKVFADKGALWTDHIFEPFLRWVNDKLAPAHWLVMTGEPGVWSDASVEIDEPGPDGDLEPYQIRVVIPIRRSA